MIGVGQHGDVLV